MHLVVQTSPSYLCPVGCHTSTGIGCYYVLKPRVGARVRVITSRENRTLMLLTTGESNPITLYPSHLRERRQQMARQSALVLLRPKGHPPSWTGSLVAYLIVGATAGVLPLGRCTSRPHGGYSSSEPSSSVPSRRAASAAAVAPATAVNSAARLVPMLYAENVHCST